MINYLKQQLALRKLQKKLRAQMKIDSAFFASARESFVALIRTKAAGVAVSRSPSYVWRYATVAIVALLALTSGVGVFAEKLDVPTDSPLYPLKRLTEQVQLAVSSPAQQVVLHQEYAQRRAKEIAVLTTEEKSKQTPEPTPEVTMNLAPALPKTFRTFARPATPASISIAASNSFKNSTQYQDRKNEIEKLKADLEQEAKTAISQSETLHVSSQERMQVCAGVVDALRQSPASSSARLARTIESKCGTSTQDR